jgi:hypothetical protein
VSLLTYVPPKGVTILSKAKHALRLFNALQALVFRARREKDVLYLNSKVNLGKQTVDLRRNNQAFQNDPKQGECPRNVGVSMSIAVNAS